MSLLENLCRFCSEELDRTESKNIFDPVNSNLLKTALLCISAPMLLDDRYPKFACVHCVFKIGVVTEFQDMGLSACRVFDEILSREECKTSDLLLPVKEEELSDVEYMEEEAKFLVPEESFSWGDGSENECKIQFSDNKTDESAYICNECGNSFELKERLQQHILTSHLSYHERFSQKGSLMHQQKRHGGDDSEDKTRSLGKGMPAPEFNNNTAKEWRNEEDDNKTEEDKTAQDLQDTQESNDDNFADSTLEQYFNSDDSVTDPDFQPHSDLHLKRKRKHDFFTPNPHDSPKSTSVAAKVVNDSKINKNNLGDEYRSPRTKRVVFPKKMGPPCSCTRKCLEKVPEDERCELFKKYWELGSLDKRRVFVARSSKILKPSYRCSAKQNPRNLNAAWFFHVNGVEIRVCKYFFVKTLGISERTVQTVRKKTDDKGFIEGERRGKHANHLTLDPVKKNAVRDFLNKIPRTGSHYLRAETSRKYIDGDRSLAQIYRDYSREENSKGNSPVSLASFKRIFYSDFNISFCIPKKDNSVAPAGV